MSLFRLACRTSDTNSTDARENEADYIFTTDRPNNVKDVAQSHNERMKNDVSNRNEASEAEKNENSHWPESADYQKIKKIAGFVPRTRKRCQFFGR